MKERNVLILLLVLCASSAVVFRIQVANALIPSVDSITVWESATHTMLNITITHNPPPTIGGGHYVSVVELDINGTISDLPQSPQSTTTFVVTYDMGVITGNFTVRSRAMCIVHGWSDWSNTMTLPEYSNLTLLLALVTVAAIIVAARLRFKVPRKSYKNRSVYCSR